MKETAHEHLEEWVMKFSGTALIGYLCSLLVCGKGLHHILQRRGLVFGVFIIPSCILSGLVGFICVYFLYQFDEKLTVDLVHGLSLVHKNLLNFVFAALMLGISCRNYQSSQLKQAGLSGILASVFHEGMPMLIYSQILGWGQSAVCLIMISIMQFGGYDVPTQFASMVPLGMEAGTDVSSTMVSSIISPTHSRDSQKKWSLAVIEESESVGLVVISLLFIACVTAKPFLVSFTASGIASHRDSIVNSHSAGMVESFEKPLTRAASERLTSRSSSIGPASFTTSPTNNENDSSDSSKERSTEKQEVANLGTHLSLIALVVFMAFGLSLGIRLIEIYFDMERRLLSNLRMFKLAMFCAMFGMNILQRRTKIVFVKDWFMRLSGLMLDLMVIAAFSVATPLPEKLIDSGQYFAIVMLVLACAAWNLTTFYFFSHRLFPNFWFERGLTLSGDAMGHSFLGLLFARTLDPHLESPVPYAYVYKLLLFFMPSSGEKNTIIVSLVDAHGPIMALVVSINIAAIWLILCEKYFSNRFVLSKYNNNSNRTICVRSDNPDEHFLSTAFDLSNGSPLDGVGANRSVLELQSPTKTLSMRSSMNNMAAITPDVTFSNNINFHTDGTSGILSNSQLSQISTWLPECHSTKTWSLKYSLRRDGACLESMMMLCCPHDNSRLYSPCIVLVEDSWGYVFGGFISPGMQNNGAYYGNGESFVFSFLPEARVYNWTTRNELFVCSNTQSFGMGGGGGGFAFQLDDEMNDGTSNASDTFDNPMLSSNEFFKCLNVEIWSLDKMSFTV